MATFLCRKCGLAVDGEVRACPKCGTEPKVKSPWALWGAALTVAVLIVSGMWQSASDSLREKRSEARPSYLFTNGDPPRVGLTRSEALRSSWGSPSNETKTTSGNGETEFWHYDQGMLMLRNGIVVSVTERR